MDFNGVCRTCLTTEFLNPIFVNSVDHKRYSTAIFVTTGLKVNQNDGLPQQMCAQCVSFLNSSLKFRKQCKDAEMKLLEIKQEKCETVNESSECEGGGDETADDEEIKDEEMELESEADTKIGYSDVTTKTEDETDAQSNSPVKDRCFKQPHRKIKKEPITRISCRLCQKDLSVRSIDSHMARSHPGADETRVKCELCDTYIMRERMNRHVKMMHGSRQFRCGYCKSEFDSKKVLVDHVANCTAKKKRRPASETGRELTQCEVCNKTMQRASLRNHVAVKHRGLGPVCEHCGRKFGNRLRLSEHLRAKHGYDKFKCSYCDFTSASSAALRNHERRHRGEKPFVCEQCGAKFHAAYLLAQHRQSHRTEKRVKCSVCGAVFKAGNSLHAHRLAVHGAALHRCPLCARAYSCRHYAVKHMRSVHHYKGPVPPLQVEPNPNEM